jgi:hypothetical protein
MKAKQKRKVIVQERTLQEVFDQIEQAVRTMRLLPRVQVKNRFCNWPEIVRSFFEAYGMDEATYKIVPTAKQISRMDEVIEWLTWLPPETARIIWARCSGLPWRTIARMAGLAPSTCESRCRIGMVVIAFNARRK